MKEYFNKLLIIFVSIEANKGLIRINKKKNVKVIFFNIKEHLFFQHDWLY